MVVLISYFLKGVSRTQVRYLCSSAVLLDLQSVTNTGAGGAGVGGAAATGNVNSSDNSGSIGGNE